MCGWLGLCIVACPPADPVRDLPRDISTAPALQLDPDARFEILFEDTGANPAPGVQTTPCAPES